jgi:transcriptional regulator with XRE-family HTH domain
MRLIGLFTGAPGQQGLKGTSLTKRCTWVADTITAPRASALTATIIGDHLLSLMPVAIATGTGPFWSQNPEGLERQLGLASPAPREMVLRSKARLGLTMSQLAKTLRVSRQTLYDWLDEDTTQNIHRDRRLRLSQLAAIATEWSRVCPVPPGRFLEQDVDGVSLLSLLEEAELDHTRIHAHMDKLRRLMELEDRQRVETLTKKLDRLGFEVPPAEEPNALSEFL